VPGAVMPSHNAQTMSVLLRRHSGFAAFDLDQNYLQSVATLCTGKQKTMIFSDGDQIHGTPSRTPAPRRSQNISLTI